MALQKAEGCMISPTELWDKVTATTGALLMSVDTTVPVIPLGKLAALNSLFQMPDSFHHETGAAKTSHSNIWCAKGSSIKTFESET